ncbi:MAG TPA: alpha-mannosidase, partial [Candidatus Xenobia bacterium]
MHRHPDYTRKRLKLLGERMWGRVHADRVPLPMEVAGPVDRVSQQVAEGLSYRPADRGLQLGPLWATYWFRGMAEVPASWAGQRVDLLWNSGSEATVWVDGRTIQGLNGSSGDHDSRLDVTLLTQARGGEKSLVRIEVACNTLFGRGHSQYDSISPFVFDHCDLARFDTEAWDLYFDFIVLQSLEADHDKGLDPSWAGELLFELNRFANVYDETERGTWAPARAILTPLLARKNAATGHELSAIGHAHIDTAWLWPVAETWRKCERTFSTQTTYMAQYPEFRFACSQACQHFEMEKRNPDLFGRMKQFAAGGQFVPVGGTWVEPDCNVPSGEALVRQFLFGQRYFEKTYGKRCLEFWNPDVFGYNGQLPQLMREAGISRFLTQKLSWNRFTKPLYHTFRWEGIDGSQVLAHFPPLDTYNATAEVG